MCVGFFVSISLKANILSKTIFMSQYEQGNAMKIV